ncbi:hypothetical protein [Pseudonocardia sp. H11422]|uniref:hypothetical protein n=1 Tax=Pseudonocardia sp. H11422 TaxID=2835866 RepID=UPI001BDD5A9E|nr:hypothetical protein [Pseudonocardia sp. H11422]
MPHLESTRVAALAGLLGTVLVLAVAGTAMALEGHGCARSGVPQDARAAVGTDPGDLHRVDRDRNEGACSSPPRRSARPVRHTPVPTPQTPVPSPRGTQPPTPASAATTAAALTR